jgi:hypothetical protein
MAGNTEKTARKSVETPDRARVPAPAGAVDRLWRPCGKWAQSAASDGADA